MEFVVEINSGFEEGLFLTKFASAVDIVEFELHVKASQILQDNVAEKSNILDPLVLFWRRKPKQTGIVRREAARSVHAGAATVKHEPCDRARYRW
jgi:thioredoxin reductase